DHGLARDRGAGHLRRLDRLDVDLFQEPRDGFAVVRLAEEILAPLGPHVADSADGVELLGRVVALHRLEEAVDRVEVARQEPRRRLADMADARWGAKGAGHGW